MTHSADFLLHDEPAPLVTRHRNRKRFAILGVLAVLLVAVWAVALLYAVGQVSAHALEGRDALLRARDAAVDLEFSIALEELEDAQEHFARADRHFYLLTPLRAVPWVGIQIKAADALLVSGRSVADALIEVVELGDELMRLSGYTEREVERMFAGVSPETTFEELPEETKRAILLRLAGSAGDLERVSHRLAIARDELSRIPSDDRLIGPIASALLPLDARLFELEQAVGTLAIAAHLLPEFAGLEGPRNHLLLFLNNTELRPGGGFIGTYGTLTMHNAEIVSLATRDVYNLDDPSAPFAPRIDPPAPLRTYLGAERWFFRDANWSPDFAVSAKKALELFQSEAAALPPEDRERIQPPAAFHHVIGFTPDYASRLLAITGPIPAGGQTFTAENVTDLLEYQVEFGFAEQGIPVSQRKEILAELVEGLKTRLFQAPLSEWLKVIEATEDSLTRKHLVFYSEDQKTEDVITRVGWGGRVLPVSGDFHLVVDANLASLKTDPAVKRDIAYSITRNNAGDYIGRTTITYRHTGRFDYKTTRYRTYTRLYLPKGSEHVRTEGSLLNDRVQNPGLLPGTTDVSEDLGYAVFGAFTSVEPGETRVLSFEYELSPAVVTSIAAGRYHLDFHKQIGAGAHGLTLDLDFDKNLTNASPPEEQNEWGDDVYRLNTILDQDREFGASL